MDPPPLAGIERENPTSAPMAGVFAENGRARATARSENPGVDLLLEGVSVALNATAEAAILPLSMTKVSVPNA